MIHDVSSGRASESRTHGKLRAPLDAFGLPSVRCACNECGAHLLASVGASGGLHGFCPTCGGERFTAVDEADRRLH